MRNKIVWLLAALLSLPLAFIPVRADAASAYDNVVKESLAELTISKHNDGTSSDFIVDWSNFVYNQAEMIDGAPVLLNLNNGTATTSQVIDAFEDRLDEGSGVAVVRDGDHSLHIYIARSSNVELSFKSYNFPWIQGGWQRNLTNETDLFYEVRVYWRDDLDKWVVNNYETTEPAIQSDQGDFKPLFINFPVDYPSGYEGRFVVNEPPTPVITTRSGTVDCGSEAPLAVNITQAGNNGSAIVTQTTLGRADWEYGFNTAEYGVQVLCGTTLATSVGLVDVIAASHDWMCDVYGDSPYTCVLS